ncbi:hypothetical protein GN956_G21064 [Arapaima gigas]
MRWIVGFGTSRKWSQTGLFSIQAEGINTLQVCFCQGPTHLQVYQSSYLLAHLQQVKERAASGCSSAGTRLLPPTLEGTAMN